MIEVDVEKRLGSFELKARFEGGAGIVALAGPSGSGKTTMARLIAGLERPDRGRIIVGDPGADGGARVLVDTEQRLFVPKHKRRIGLVFQDAQLFPHLTVKQNLLFGRLFAPRIEGHVAFDAVVETLGIGHLLGRRTPRLSGGERQRVAIGRALLASPRLLVMDEPLAALDEARKAEILPLIERLRDGFGLPIVYVSHAMAEVARLAETVVAFSEGKVVAAGPPAVVLGTARLALERSGGGRFGRASVLDVVAGLVDTAYSLTTLHHRGGDLSLPGRVGPPGRALRVVIAATDVTLATERPHGLSVRNALDGYIVAITPDGEALAVIDIALPGGGRLAASATRQALDALGLSVGSTVYALVKTVALDERTMSG